MILLKIQQHPLLVFSQDLSYEGSISISELNNSLKIAAEKGEDFTLNNKIILYDSKTDKKFNSNQVLLEVSTDNFNSRIYNKSEIILFFASFVSSPLIKSELIHIPLPTNKSSL